MQLAVRDFRVCGFSFSGSLVWRFFASGLRVIRDRKLYVRKVLSQFLATRTGTLWIPRVPCSKVMLLTKTREDLLELGT